jgi:lipopolysaccharide assembly outer membrane protein LptD (OstA)
MVHSLMLFSQEEKTVIDTLIIKKKSLAPDSILIKRGLSKDAIEMPITHVAAGYRKTDLINKKVYLVKDAVVTYGDITLKADSIELNMETGLVFAIGRKDSTGKIVGSPDFKQGSEQFTSKELTYNFKTKKGLIKNIFTEQEQGYLHSEVSKRMEDGTININRSTFSTCNLEHPHFSVNFNKAKVIPGKKIISGPAYLVLEDIPLPLVLPFGYFPIQKNRQSGLILPKYGESQQLGYSLRDGGYYFVFNDYIDLSMTGTLYTNGTWTINASSRYLKLYKYSGDFSISYASNISGHKGLPDYNKSSNYRVGWTYNQNEKAMPGSRFSASVNMSSSGFDRNNSYTVSEHINTQRQSSISYSRNWMGTPYNLSASLNHSQNVKNKTISLNLPKVNFNVARIYPLKNKNNPGVSKWYQELTFSYSASIDNQINTRDSLLFTKAVWNNMRNGFKHEMPVSFQLRPFRNFSISPQLMYSGVLYTQKIEKKWVPDYYNSNQNKVVPTVINDTIRGAFYGQSVNPSISASFNPQVFGTYDFSLSGGRLQAIRHIMRPAVSFSYTPVLKGLTTSMYKQVQIDTLGRIREYSVFEGNIFGTPSLSGRSGAFSFSLVNILEAKVFEKNDTSGKPKKVKLIENLSLGTSYNIFADSLRWSPVSMSFRTILFENLNFAANSSFSLYGLDSKGTTINTYYFTQTKKPLRMTSLSATLDFDLGQLIKGKSKKKGKITNQGKSPANPGYGNPDSGKSSDIINTPVSGALPLDQYGYVPFDVPWSLRLAYNFYYTKGAFKSAISQTLALSGDVSLTKKTRINYTTGFDIARKEITMTSVGITRDLHCWDMSLDWIPTGYMKSWQFVIKVKASVLADLKYDRRKDFRDQY